MTATETAPTEGTETECNCIGGHRDEFGPHAAPATPHDPIDPQTGEYCENPACHGEAPASSLVERLKHKLDRECNCLACEAAAALEAKDAALREIQELIPVADTWEGYEVLDLAEIIERSWEIVEAALGEK